VCHYGDRSGPSIFLLSVRIRVERMRATIDGAAAHRDDRQFKSDGAPDQQESQWRHLRRAVTAVELAGLILDGAPGRKF
jgi:hypothetical protein